MRIKIFDLVRIQTDEYNELCLYNTIASAGQFWMRSLAALPLWSSCNLVNHPHQMRNGRPHFDDYHLTNSNNMPFESLQINISKWLRVQCIVLQLFRFFAIFVFKLFYRMVSMATALDPNFWCWIISWLKTYLLTPLLWSLRLQIKIYTT